MDKIERLIKAHLKKNTDIDMGNKTKQCPDEHTLLSYMEHILDTRENQLIEEHLAQCGFCLSQLSMAFEARRMQGQKEVPAAPQGLVDKAKALLKPDKNADEMRTAAKKRIKKNLFLAGTILSFILSFLIPRYFMQFLAAALILGLRWAFESESGRTLVMVIDSWRRHSRDDDEQISRRLKDRV